MKRRQFLQSMTASLVLMQSPLTAASQSILAGTNKATQDLNNKKIIWVILRGAMDSLHTLVPSFDENLLNLRPKLLAKIKDDLLPLDQGFALHPSLKNMHQWYGDGELLPITAVSSGYAKRSHFDGQDFLESGYPTINYDSGWLGRAVTLKSKQALAIANSTPISLRSGTDVNTWYPTNLKEADDDIYQRLLNMYQNDEMLVKQLQSGISAKQMVGTMATKTKRKGRFVELSKACAKLMTGDSKVDCAMLELGGWDTHNNQANRLSHQLAELDAGLAALKEGLGEQWQNSVVIVGTEFGRTAKENGTGGTDHGTASAMFIAGGHVKGGKVLGEWPGLKDHQLFEQRDLMPTSNTFSWLATILSQHWSLSDKALSEIFPKVTKMDDKLFFS